MGREVVLRTLSFVRSAWCAWRSCSHWSLPCLISGFNGGRDSFHLHGVVVEFARCSTGNDMSAISPYPADTSRSLGFN